MEMLPVCVKSWVPRLVTGTPTAAAPWMSEPVIRTCSGTASGPACAIICAWAAKLVSVRKDADPIRVANRDADEFIEFLPLMGAIFCALSNAWGVVHPGHRRGDERKRSLRQCKKLCQAVSELYGSVAESAGISLYLWQLCHLRYS